MGSSVEREVYSNRAAEMAGVAPDSMRLEVSRAYKRRINAQKKREERQNLRPAEQLQPTVSGLKMRSASLLWQRKACWARSFWTRPCWISPKT